MHEITEGSALVGLVLLIVAALGAGGWRTEIQARRTVRRTLPTPIASWRPGRGTVAGQGFIDYGPAGPQTGPLTGLDCAWYRFTLERVTSTDWGDGWSHTAELLIELEPPAWAVFADETGRAALDPSMLDIESQSDPRITQTRTVRYSTDKPVPLPSLVPASVVRDLGSEQSLTLTEVLVRQGRPVYALGRVRGPAVALAPNGRGYSVCTTDARDQVIANRDEAAGDNRSTATFMLIFALLIIAAGQGVSYLGS